MTVVDTPSTAYPKIKIIRSLWSQNTSNISSRKYCKKYGANKPVHDEVDYAIVSHQKSKFLVESNLIQEEGRTTIVDNLSKEYPAQATQNSME